MRSKDVMLDEFAKTYIAAGNLDAALKSAEESMELLRRIARRALTMASHRDLSVGLIRIGDIKRAQGDQEGALAAYEESLLCVASSPKPKRAMGMRNTASRRASTGSAISGFNPPSRRKRSRPLGKALPSAAR